MGLKIKKKKEKSDTKKVGTFTILKKLILHVGAGKRRLVIPLIILLLLNVIIGWFTPLIFKSLVDDGLGGGIGATGGNIQIIISLGTIFFVSTIAGVVARIAQDFIIQKLAVITMYNLRHDLFEKFQRLGLDFHESTKMTTGKEINYLTADVNTIQELIQSGLLVAISDAFLVFGALFFMIILSPILTLVLFMILPIIIVIAAILFRIARKYFKPLRESVANVTSILDESIMGMKIIQSFTVEETNFREFNIATKLERHMTMKAAKISAIVPAIVFVFIAGSFVTVFFVSGVLIRQGLLTQGILVAFFFYIFTFFEQLYSLINFGTVLQDSLAAGARIIQLLDEDILIKEKEDALEIEGIKGEIDYNNVNFYYKENEPVLNNINIAIKEKERLALVGYTGAGKSSFIKLLCRFYDPIQGEIHVDNINLKDMKIKNLRDNLGIVLQDNFLFTGTIKDNIKYGKLTATDEEIVEVAKKINVHELIMDLDNGYDTIVGERGSRLSEGQRQLIAFTRALISNPPILILDEATSSIDPYSELLIQEALETLLKGKTSVSIAHRLSTIINSDRIIVLDKGEILEQGSHQELIENGGFYKHLYEMQFRDPFKDDNSKKKKTIKPLI